jgi:salicylate hydroxylase
MPTRTDEPGREPSGISPEEFRVAIIGGGIGGLTAALSIATYSPQLANITVYEQAPEYSEIGAGVGIGIQAGRVLQKLGLWEKANAISGDRNSIHRSTRRWDNDELIVDVPAVNNEGMVGGVGQLWVHRAEILDVLTTEIRRRKCARLETDKRAIKLTVWAFRIPIFRFVFTHVDSLGQWFDCFHRFCRRHQYFYPSCHSLRWHPQHDTISICY